MKKSIWVIDDDEIYQMIIKKLLQKSNAFDQADFYMNAAAVLKDLVSSKIFLPDILLLDINMPQMDGWQFLEKLRDQFPDLGKRTRIFIVSSSIAYSDKERADNYPELLGFLTKPVSVNQLREIGMQVHKKSQA